MHLVRIKKMEVPQNSGNAFELIYEQKIMTEALMVSLKK